MRRYFDVGNKYWRLLLPVSSYKNQTINLEIEKDAVYKEEIIRKVKNKGKDKPDIINEDAPQIEDRCYVVICIGKELIFIDFNGKTSCERTSYGFYIGLEWGIRFMSGPDESLNRKNIYHAIEQLAKNNILYINNKFTPKIININGEDVFMDYDIKIEIFEGKTDWFGTHHRIGAKLGEKISSIINKIFDMIISTGYYRLDRPIYKNIKELDIHKVDLYNTNIEIEMNKSIIYINDLVFLWDHKNREYLYNIIESRKRQNKLDFTPRTSVCKYYYYFPYYIKYDTIYLSNSKEERSYSTDEYHVINTCGKDIDEIVEEICYIKKKKAKVFIETKYGIADKNKMEIIIDGDKKGKCLLSIIDNHWFINKQPTISHRYSTLSIKDIKKNLLLNKDRIEKSFIKEDYGDAYFKSTSSLLESIMESLPIKKLNKNHDSYDKNIKILTFEDIISETDKRDEIVNELINKIWKVLLKTT